MIDLIQSIPFWAWAAGSLFIVFWTGFMTGMGLMAIMASAKRADEQCSQE